MRRITIMGAILVCLPILGCSADKEFEQKQRDWEEYSRNWSINQYNLEQARLELDLAKQDPNRIEKEQTQPVWDQPLEDPNQFPQEQAWQDPNETEQDRDPQQEESSETQTETDIPPVVKLNPEIIPLESIIEIKGDYDCFPPHPYSITINQKGDVVLITNITDNNESREFSLHIKRFKLFWQIFASVDIMSLDQSYGVWIDSTVDYRGYLTIDIQTEEGRISKKIFVFKPHAVKDEEFNKLLYIITWLVGEDIDIPGFLKPWED